ncbi:MAG TPA: arginine--tRNA ligase [Clostridia bacterium]|jgi:arginyl-tRNA synthetase|nr:arginine--tRNA ligase [Clostridia bacterium]
MDVVANMQKEITGYLEGAARAAREAGEIRYDTLPDFVVEVPREKEHGDFASNIAMLLAREAKKAPREIAGIILDHLDFDYTPIQEATIAGPGFINFKLRPSWLYPAMESADRADRAYGRSNIGQGKKVQVEFVSANPTGSLHMGNARGAALGDTIASVLEAAGYNVTREFYINDAGNQIENFALSLEARYFQLLGREAEVPEDGYHGEDLVETMEHLVSKVGDRYLDASEEFRREMLVEFALEEKINEIKGTLKDFGVEYDVWFSERTLHEDGSIEETLKELQEKGYIYEKEGALWFKSTLFGDSKDEVLVRANGMPTYFAADIAYHKNKFQRGFDWVINVWGADHHGHVPRMKGAIEALGYKREQLDVVIMQLVRLFSGGETLRMSKRTGQYITLRELMDEVGKDAARFFFVMRAADSHLDFDLDLAKSQSSENPVYYVQYAHARICSILRQAVAQNVPVVRAFKVNFYCLDHPAEYDLMRKIADLPGVVKAAAETLEPHRLTHYAMELAQQFHKFYTECRVLGEDAEKQSARIVLVNVTRIVLRNVLDLIGVEAPERM